MNLLHSGCTLYIWGAVGALIVILNRVARFYQITSGRRSYYQLFWLPLALMGLGALCYAGLVGDVLDDRLTLAGDLLMLAGGLLLFGLGYYLFRLMTGSRT
jgi:hypothetical protein